MKQTLNEEINRIKMLLNIKESNIILEANPILGIVRRLGSAIESRFITGIEAKMGKTLANASDTEITTALKSAEMAVIRKEIADAIYIADKNIIDSVLSKYNMTIPGDAAAAYTELSAQGYNRAILKDINKAYKAGRTSSGAGGGSSAGGRAGSNAMSDPIDSIINKLDDIDVGEIDINEIIRRNITNPRFQEYRVILRGISMTDEVRNMMLAAYDIIGKDPVKAIEYAGKLQSKLNEKQYGWVKRGINQATKNPTKTITILGKTIATGTFWGITAFAILSLGGIAIGWINWAKQSIPKAPSSDTETPNTNNNDPLGIR
jgi:hypothetical protein